MSVGRTTRDVHVLKCWDEYCCWGKHWITEAIISKNCSLLVVETCYMYQRLRVSIDLRKRFDITVTLLKIFRAGQIKDHAVCVIIEAFVKIYAKDSIAVIQREFSSGFKDLTISERFLGLICPASMNFNNGNYACPAAEQYTEPAMTEILRL